MPRTTGGLRAGPSARLVDLERRRPEWQAWFRMLKEVERTLEAASRQSPVSHEPRVASSANAPLLQGRTLRVDAAELQRLIARLAATASEIEGGTSLRGYRPSAEDTVALIGAAVRQDRDAIASVAARRGLDAAALASVIHLAALPLLRSCGRALRAQVPTYWPHGYCPVCAAWPLLAERRGLDRTRRLRCGRCAGEWEIEWLTCIFCGERNHQQLGSLVPDDGELLKVETCASCNGYLKSIATLQAIPDFELLLRDLETVELDLVALERGYGRPAENGFRMEVKLV